MYVACVSNVHFSQFPAESGLTANGQWSTGVWYGFLKYLDPDRPKTIKDRAPVEHPPPTRG